MHLGLSGAKYARENMLIYRLLDRWEQTSVKFEQNTKQYIKEINLNL